MLNILSCSPFEPLEQVELKMLSLKVALLLALASTKHIGEIHVLSVHWACIQFSQGSIKVIYNLTWPLYKRLWGHARP